MAWRRGTHGSSTGSKGGMPSRSLAVSRSLQAGRTIRLFMSPGTAAIPDWGFQGRGHRLITLFRGSSGRLLRERCPFPGVLRPHSLKLPGSSRASGNLAGLGLPSGAWLKSPGAGNPQGDDPFSGLPQCWHLHKTESSQLFRHRTNSAHLFALKQEHPFPVPPGIIMPTAGQSEKYTS